ncbi:hypothetical protein DL95DRAFT_414500 [Leptodontidium sp. 2 PMI_412]|nr:hypothetical protein DL95DRAFT_414500 [Leptodontidium sp. 2 PMI_412]
MALSKLESYSRERVAVAERFHRRHHESLAVKFFDWIATSFGFDQIAQHEQQLEDCGRAVELVIETVNAWSIAHEQRRIFNFAENDGFAGGASSWHETLAVNTRRYQRCTKRLEDVRERTRRHSYLHRMRRARVDIPALRQHARRILYQDNSGSRSTISPRPSYNPLRNAAQPDPSIRFSPVEPLPDIHVLPREHERVPSMYQPYAPAMARRTVQQPHIVTAIPSESGPTLYHQHGPNLPASAPGPSRYPRIVDLQDRERERDVSPITNEHGPPIRRVDGYRVSTQTNSQDRNPDARRYIQRPSDSTSENISTHDYCSRQRDSASQNHGRDLRTARDHGTSTNERQPYTPQREGQNQAATYVNTVPRQHSERGRQRSRSPRRQNRQSESQDLVPERSSISRRDKIYVTDASPHRLPPNNVDVHPQLSGSYDPNRTESRRRTSRTRPSSPEDSRSRESSRRTSTSSSRPPSMSRDHQPQSGRSRRASSSSSNYDSGIDVTSNSGRNTTFDRSAAQVPNVNRATRPPISMSQKLSRRTSSASSYDSGVFMSRSGSSDQSLPAELPIPRQSNVLQSYPPSSFYFDQDRPMRRRRSSRSRSSQGRERERRRLVRGDREGHEM